MLLARRSPKAIIPRLVCKAVDQDEGASVAVDCVSIERHGCGSRQIAEPDLVQAEGLVRQMRQRIHIDAMPERGDGSRERARSDLQQVGAAGDERLVTHPDDMGGKLVDEFWGFARLRKNIATRDVDLAIKGQGDGVARLRTIERALVGHDLLDSRGSAQARNDQLIAGRDRSRHYPAGKAAELRVWSVHPLDRKAERQLAGAARNLDRMQVLD